MTLTRYRRIVIVTGLLAVCSSAASAGSEPAALESRRMARAKDLIADEQWTRAIEELRAATADPREPNKDEALFWLAHSQNQDNDFAAAVESIRRLEREHPSSRWVKPARSLLIELAQKLKRDDVLWWTAAAPVRPGMVPVAVTPTPPAATTPRPGMRRPRPVPSETVSAPRAIPPEMLPVPAPGPATTPPPAWVVETWNPDTDQRIQALGILIHTNEKRVVDMLRHIALEDKSPGAARQALFVLAESRKPEAQSAVVEIANRGPEPVRVAAVRELGRFGGPEASKALLQVYSSAKAPAVKRQVLASLGVRSEAPALFRIALSEGDSSLRSSAIVILGKAGGREQLLMLYGKVDRNSKRPIILGLFNARADDELIRIAEDEQDEGLRAEALSRLRLLGTMKARTYLTKKSQ